MNVGPIVTTARVVNKSRVPREQWQSREGARPASKFEEDAERPQRHSHAERGNEGLRNPPAHSFGASNAFYCG
jgi:hypothetical protein